MEKRRKLLEVNSKEGKDDTKGNNGRICKIRKGTHVMEGAL